MSGFDERESVCDFWVEDQFIKGVNLVDGPYTCASTACKSRANYILLVQFEGVITSSMRKTWFNCHFMSLLVLFGDPVKIRSH